MIPQIKSSKELIKTQLKTLRLPQISKIRTKEMPRKPPTKELIRKQLSKSRKEQGQEQMSANRI
jgi:hypothetical protein